MSLLARLADKNTPKNPIRGGFFIEAIKKYDSIPQLLRTPIGAESYIHSSSLENFCARRAAILDRENRTPREYVKGADKVVWAMGRAAENHIRVALIQSLGAKNFFGKWSSECGKYSFTGTWVKSDIKYTKYDEVTFYDDELKVSGNPDMIYVDQDGYMTPIEIKSKNKRDFDALEEPEESHARQVSRYVRLLKINGHRVRNEAKIIYVCKDYSFKDVYKEFTIDASCDKYTSTHAEELDQAAKYRQYHKTGELPEREFCSSAMSKLAKGCPACNACFANTK